MSRNKAKRRALVDMILKIRISYKAWSWTIGAIDSSLIVHCRPNLQHVKCSFEITHCLNSFSSVFKIKLRVHCRGRRAQICRCLE